MSIETGTLEDSSPQLHLKASGDSQFSGEGSVMKPPARVNIWYLSWNLIIFSNRNKEKGCASRFLPKQFFFGVQKPTNLCRFGRFWSIFSRGKFSGHTRSSPRQRSCYFTYKIFGSGHSSAQCLGGCLWGIWGGGNPVYRSTWNKGNLARSTSFFKTIVWNRTVQINVLSSKDQGSFLCSRYARTYMYHVSI